MFKRPPSHLVAHRGTRGSSTISSAIAVFAIAGLALGACSAPAGGAISGQAFDSFDSHRAKEQQRSLAVTIPATPAETSDDSWDSLRKEHRPSLAATTQVTSAKTSDDSWDSLRKEHRPSLAATAQSGPVMIPEAAR